MAMMSGSDLVERKFDIEQTGDESCTVTRFNPREDYNPDGSITATVRPGLKVSIVDVAHPMAEERRYNPEDMLKLHIRLQGGVRIGGDHQHNAALSGGMMLMLAQPRDSEKLEIVAAEHERSITIACSRDFLDDLARQSGASLPPIVRNFTRGRSSVFALEPMALTLQTRRIAEEMLGSAQSSSFRHLMYEAKALELLCAALEAAVHRDSGDASIKQRDRSRVDELCALLQGDAGTTLSIGDLCRAVAWNETQMMESFKKVTGMTISGYRHQLAMDRALKRLSGSEAKIAEVALDAGYDHPGNFATAFRRTFGFSPRAARSMRHT